METQCQSPFVERPVCQHPCVETWVPVSLCGNLARLDGSCLMVGWSLVGVDQKKHSLPVAMLSKHSIETEEGPCQVHPKRVIKPTPVSERTLELSL